MLLHLFSSSKFSHFRIAFLFLILRGYSGLSTIVLEADDRVGGRVRPIHGEIGRFFLLSHL